MMTEPLVDVRCFSHVGVSVQDIERSVEFYMGLFGFEKLFENSEEGWARVGLRVGDVQLELFSPHPGGQDCARPAPSASRQRASRIRS